MKLKNKLDDIKENYFNTQKDNKEIVIAVGMGTCGIAAGAEEVWEAIKDEIENRNLENIKLEKTGCIGLCAREPLIEIRENNESTFYGDLNKERVREIVFQHIVQNNIISKWTIDTGNDFFKDQKRIVLKNCGKIDPESIEEAIANEAYQGIAKILNEMESIDVVNLIKEEN